MLLTLFYKVLLCFAKGQGRKLGGEVFGHFATKHGETPFIAMAIFGGKKSKEIADGGSSVQ